LFLTLNLSKQVAEKVDSEIILGNKFIERFTQLIVYAQGEIFAIIHYQARNDLFQQPAKGLRAFVWIDTPVNRF
jgi:hypothetical protein